MRHIELSVHCREVDAAEAYRRIQRFESYPELVDEVRAVAVRESGGAGRNESDWEVYFRNGPLRWSETDSFDPGAHRIEFEQIDGDFDVFRGSWQVTAHPPGCTVTFETTFDFGIPSLAGVLEPVATKVLREGIAVVLYRLLGRIDPVADPVLHAALTARLGADAFAAVPAG